MHRINGRLAVALVLWATCVSLFVSGAIRASNSITHSFYEVSNHRPKVALASIPPAQVTRPAVTTQAQVTVPAVITLSVEQPAYTGMPIWLHLLTRDNCFEHFTPATYPWFEYLWLRDDGAEVTREGQPVPRANVDARNIIRLPGLHSCPGQPHLEETRDHRFALSGAYVFDQSGHYIVRWITKDEDQHDGTDEQTGWVDFDVKDSTARQRSSWLDSMLSKELFSPDGKEKVDIIYEYIPELLSGWRDPRVTRKLLDLTCSGVKDVSIAAGVSLHYDLDHDAAAYFADLINRGCYWDFSFISRFLLRHSHELAPVRSKLLRSFAGHLNKKAPDGAELTDAIWAIAVVRRDIPSGKADKSVNGWADAEVVRASPTLRAPHDSAGMNYTQLSVAGLIKYLSREDLTQPEHALLRTMAYDRFMGLEAFEALVARRDPSDLPTIAGVLANMPYLQWSNYTTDLKSVAEHFGRTALPMLQTIALHGKDLQLRATAALELLRRGDNEADGVIAEAAKSSNWRAQMVARGGLNDLAKQQISLESLAFLCRSYVAGDPCGAREVVIPSRMVLHHLP